ncbi:MAG: [FeFe] hydrogenase H-cluster radical SAM maturase HydG [Thermodesulfobacteriota bacterium]
MVVDTDRIEKIIAKTKRPSIADVDKILERVDRLEGLSLEDSAVLLEIHDPDVLEKVYIKAGEVKERVFGRRIVLFAPLYLSNYCTNDCLYCGFRRNNIGESRSALTIDRVIKEAKTLEDMGFKRILLVCGEDPGVSTLDYIVSSVKALYRGTGIRIVHVNAPPLDVYGFRRLKEAGVGVYQVFQETYHRSTYRHMHPSGKKRDYEFRLETMDRAMKGGFDDVGIGALLGLYDYRYDCLSTIAHSRYLYGRYGTHAHTISVPRLRPAQGFAIGDIPFKVSDEEFKKIIAVYRLAVPSAGIVVSTREGNELRDDVIRSGASQISAGSKTNPGGYTLNAGISEVVGKKKVIEQFSIKDRRTVSEVIESIIKDGLIPSLCASCYRVGRTGKEFTKKTLAGDMERVCNANAILTLQEYILDYAKDGIKEAGINTIERGLEGIKEPSFKAEVLKRLIEIRKGRRDVYF